MSSLSLLVFLAGITWIHAETPMEKIKFYETMTRHSFKTSSALSRLKQYHMTNVEMRLNEQHEFKSFSNSHSFHALSNNAQPYYPETLQLRLSIPSSYHTSSTSSTPTSHILTLVRHTELFSADYATYGHVYDDNGQLLHVDKHQPESITSWHCYYRGIDTQHDLALSLCNGVSGVIVMNGKHLYIEPGHQHIESLDTKSSRHLIFDSLEDTINQPIACGVGNKANMEHPAAPLAAPQDTTSSHQHPSSSSQHTSSSSSSHIPSLSHHRHLTAGIAQTYVELLVVNDHKRLLTFADRTTMEQNAAQTISITDLIYRGITATDAPWVRVVLVGQVTFLAQDPYTFSTACDHCAPGEILSNNLLDAFNTWNKNGIQTNTLQHHDNAQLLSAYDFENATVGLAGIGVMCSTSLSGSIVQATFTAATNAATSAHEMGHNWGMIHDGTTNSQLSPPITNKCDSHAYVMAAYACTQCSNGQTPSFSTCSPTEMASYYTGTSMTNSGTKKTCVDNAPSTSASIAQCQNGLVEAGEDCDCGAANCDTIDPCCNGSTCKLKPGNQCSKLDGCCTAQCTFKPINTVCRAASTSCDIEEKCSGSSGKCPPDNFKGAGFGCPGGLCYNNICRTKDDQCSTMNPVNAWQHCPPTAEAYFLNQAIADGPLQTPPIVEPTVCGRLYCHQKTTSDPNSCSQGFQDLSAGASSFPFVRLYDGMPCGNGNQCLSGSCVPPSQLMTTTFQWQTTAWTPTTCACTDYQTRTVTCVDQRSWNQGVVAPDAACSPMNQPISSQLCRASPCPGDTIAPSISNCPTDQTFSSHGKPNVTITWTDPSFSDNHDAMSALRIFQNYHSGDAFVTDTSYYIQYNVWDTSGNQASCGFTYTVQSADLPGDGSIFGLEKKYLYIIVAAAGACIFFCCVGYYCCSGKRSPDRRYNDNNGGKSAAQIKLEQRRAERDARASAIPPNVAAIQLEGRRQ